MENLIINHWAVLACAVLSLVLGGLWYSPLLFYRGWKDATGLTEERLKAVKPYKAYTVTFVLAYIMSYNMAFFLGDPGTGWKWATLAGLLAGFGWAAAMFAVIALFELRSWKYILINCGFIVMYFTVMGFILGIWR